MQGQSLRGLVESLGAEGFYQKVCGLLNERKISVDDFSYYELADACGVLPDLRRLNEMVSPGSGPLQVLRESNPGVSTTNNGTASSTVRHGLRYDLATVSRAEPRANRATRTSAMSTIGISCLTACCPNCIVLALELLGKGYDVVLSLHVSPARPAHLIPMLRVGQELSQLLAQCGNVMLGYQVTAGTIDDNLRNVGMQG